LQSEEKNLIIILGPTGVGKSAATLKLAKVFNGEIINCDSMQVYKGFDIGTDKLPIEKRENIHHHLIDILSPEKQFTAADFVQKALSAIESIHKKKKLPFITGGTGLYLKALLDGLFPEGKKDPAIRQKLEQEVKEKGLKYLREKLEKIDPSYARKIGKNDKIRIIRALEVFNTTKKSLSEHFKNTKSYVTDFHIIRIGLKLERQELYKHIEDRVDRMFERGIVKEVQSLIKKGVKEKSPPFRALGYKQILEYQKGKISLEQAVSLTKRETRHYAKRQMTWFKKMKGIRWFSTHEFSAIQEHIKINLK